MRTKFARRWPYRKTSLKPSTSKKSLRFKAEIFLFPSYGVGDLFQDRLNSAEDPSFYCPRPPNSQRQMFCESIEPISFFRHLRPPSIFLCARCVGHCEMMWSAAPHSQFENEVRLDPIFLYIDEQQHSTQGRRRLCLTKNALDKSTGVVQTLGVKARITDKLLGYFMFHFVFVHWAARMSKEFPCGRYKWSRFKSLLTFCDQCN